MTEMFQQKKKTSFKCLQTFINTSVKLQCASIIHR